MTRPADHIHTIWADPTLRELASLGIDDRVQVQAQRKSQYPNMIIAPLRIRVELEKMTSQFCEMIWIYEIASLRPLSFSS